MSARIDQFRKRFLEWLDARIAELSNRWQQETESGNIPKVISLAAQLDELERVRKYFLAMSRTKG